MNAFDSIVAVSSVCCYLGTGILLHRQMDEKKYASRLLALKLATKTYMAWLSDREQQVNNNF